LKNYNCKELRRAAEAVTVLTTTAPPHPKQPVYGERSTDLVYGFLGTGNFDLAEFFGEQRSNRMSTLATPKMIKDHLVINFGENPDFTEEMGLKMKEKMLLDLHECRKEEYQSATGIAILFDRAGGKLTGEMAETIAKISLKSPYHIILMEEIKKKWDEWDVKDGVKDDCLQFDHFYHAFAAPFLGCYRCKRTRAAFAALDMDKDGQVDWNEFQVYLKWALHEYPDVKNIEELLTIAFQKGLLPAMMDEEAKILLPGDQSGQPDEN